MWKTALLVCSVVGCVLAVGKYNEFIRNGTWTTYSMYRCDNPEKYAADVEINKRKVSRSHDGFNLTIDFPYDITSEEFGLHIEVYKKCDGGYKFQQNIDDPSLCGIVNQYAKGNFERALTSAGIDPPNCPIPKGVLNIKDFVMDYDELPTEGLVGDYQIIAVVLRQTEELCCIGAEVGFIIDEDDDDYDEEDAWSMV